MAIITLTTCNTSFEANLIKGMLENNGIECFLSNENFSTLMPMYNGVMGAGVQILIEESDLRQAQELLDANQEQVETDEYLIACPNCKSTNIQFGLGTGKLKKLLVILLSVFTSNPFGNIRNLYLCKDCKTEFRA